MGFLRKGLFFPAVVPWLQVALPKSLANYLVNDFEGFRCQVRGIRSHVGNVALLIERLRGGHRSANRKAQFSLGLLLEGRGGERRWGMFQALLLLDVGNA
jgi:hypothetical protein